MMGSSFRFTFILNRWAPFSEGEGPGMRSNNAIANEEYI